MLKTRVKGFTLLECLIALLVIAGSLSVYQGLTKLLSSHTSYLTVNHQDNWLLFCQHLRVEWQGATFDKLEGNRLYLTKEGQALSFGKFRSDDFRKSNADGRGYQPMLFGVSSADFSQSGEVVTLQVTFDKGLERIFVYAFDKTP
ncbi:MULTISPECIES: competence type IV pilus minor pilin ComGF [unclassified Streptococcus]|uniref:competence type IV pilus minor pilin ComGF n=1 Tax=unclassified Streptococcus TaxID=2608887 RepID=UPI00359E1173